MALGGEALDRLREAVLVRAPHLVDLGAVFVEVEGGHRADAAGLGHVARLVHVHLDEDLRGVTVSETRSRK